VIFRFGGVEVDERRFELRHEGKVVPVHASTRASVGYTPLEVFPELWGMALPVLQLVKALPAAG
jgi:hypothetical protein